MRFTVYTLLFFLTIGLACSEKTPEYLLDEETYIMIFAELAVIDQYDPNLLKNRSKEDLRKLVFETYSVTAEDFRQSHQYYELNIEEQIRRVEEVNNRLREERDSVNVFEREERKRLMPSADSLRQRLGIQNLPPDSVSM